MEVYMKVILHKTVSVKKVVETRTGLNGSLCIQLHGRSATPGATFPTPCEKCVGFLTSLLTISEKRKGDGAYGLSFLPEKNRCQSKGSIFYSIFYDPECWSGLELGLSTSSTLVRRSTSWKRESSKFRKWIPFPSSWSLSVLFSWEKYFGNYISIRN